MLFAGSQEEGDGRFCEGSEKHLAPKRPDFGRREDKDATRHPARDALNAGCERRKQAVARVDVVPGRRSFYSNGLHASFILKDLDCVFVERN